VCSHLNPGWGTKLAPKSQLKHLARLIGHYDLRAAYPSELDEEGGETLGHVLSSYLGESVLIGRDPREESRKIAKALTSGLLRSGTKVSSLGIVPTPLVAFAACRWHSPAIVVTPSHNPKGQTGLKIFDGQGRLWGKEWDRIRRELESGRRPSSRSPCSQGIVSTPLVSRAGLERGYLAAVRKLEAADLKVAVDSRGGAVSGWATKALKAMGLEVTAIHDRPSPTFYGASPEPTPENIGELRDLVRTTSSNIGVSFDGDGDRILIVDEWGEISPPEAVALLFHRELEKGEHPLVASSDCSPRLIRLAPLVQAAVGSRNIIERMREVSSPVGFELSNHYYLREVNYASDGIWVACRLSSILCNEGLSLGRWTSGLHLPVRRQLSLRLRHGSDATTLFTELKRLWGNNWVPLYDGMVWNGARGERIFVRQSNTEPAVRFVFEGSSPAIQRCVAHIENYAAYPHETNSSQNLVQYCALL
jgi:phosphomannomutase/phosphoglucomutase